jgi:hypothetical protein
MYNMARMKELYEDVREMFDQGMSDDAIAYATGQPIEFIRGFTQQFEDEFDDLEYFPDGVSDPDYVITGCDPCEYDEVAAEDFAADEIEY